MTAAQGRPSYFQYPNNKNSMEIVAGRNNITAGINQGCRNKENSTGNM